MMKLCFKYLKDIIYVNKNAGEKKQLSFLFSIPLSNFIVLLSVYELLIDNIYHYPSNLIIFKSHNHHCPKLVKTGGIV